MADELQVNLIVYDLFPVSRLGTLLNVLGTGVYHTSISISIPLGGESASSPTPREWAFGGHATPGLTGVFVVPTGQAATRMPHVRPYLQLDVGPAFGDDWAREFGPKLKRKREAGGSASSLSSSLSSAASSWRLYGAQGATSSRLKLDQDDDPFKDPVTDSTRPDGYEWEMEDDGGVSDGTEYMTRTQRRAWRIVEAMRKDDEWSGTRYRLLGRNCNNFTDELCYRLTGRRAPPWINRAAWVATSVPCLIPEGWVDEDELNNSAAPPNPSSSSSSTTTTAGQGAAASVVVVPPRADHHMSIAAELSDPGRARRESEGEGKVAHNVTLASSLNRSMSVLS